jgi:protein-tyrosine-phosphatase
MSTVLFVCRQNAGRSQMSQALFRRASGGQHEALSAGTTPAGQPLDHVRTIRDDIDQRVHALLDELA